PHTDHVELRVVALDLEREEMHVVPALDPTDPPPEVLALAQRPPGLAACHRSPRRIRDHDLFDDALGAVGEAGLAGTEPPEEGHLLVRRDPERSVEPEQVHLVADGGVAVALAGEER